MSQIFISYASEDRQRAQELAAALGLHGWSVWWDRKIPLGKSFDEVIERALGESKCVIVLWSVVSAASEWVRNEASEAKRRGILVPVFLEAVDAPLAFRLLNGANLSNWQARIADPEFDKLIERVTELLGKPEPPVGTPVHDAATTFTGRQQKEHDGRSPWILWLAGGLAVAALAVAMVGFFSNGRQPIAPTPELPLKSGITRPQVPAGFDVAELEKALQGFAAIGSSVPATAVTTAFHVPDLGLRVAFLGPQQSPSAALPSGGLVMEVESSGAAAKAGIHVFDIIEGIGGHTIESVDDLRQSLRKLGPGKTQFTVRSPNGPKTVVVDCSKCKPE